MAVDVGQTRLLLEDWLAVRLTPDALAWVRDRFAAISQGDKKALYIAFGLAPRKVGKADLALTVEDQKAAATACKDWNPAGWSTDQTVRTLFVLAWPADDLQTYVSTLDQLFSVGEVGELVAIYQALPLLPHPASHVLRAAEGIRSNIKSVFCAVAHHNPFPAEHFSEDQWNQMVLKCQFIGVSMSPIIGLDRRANRHLAEMVVDFIHERWAAKRPVPAEMWQCVGPFANAQGLADLDHLVTTATGVDQQAAALALSQCPDPTAKQILAKVPELARQIAAGTLTWSAIDSNSN